MAEVSRKLTPACSGDLSRLEGKIAQSIYGTIEDEMLHAQRLGERRSWRFHGMKSVTVPTIRLNEINKGEQILQLVARFESDQSLELRDTAGRLKPGSGKHDKPERIIEVCWSAKHASRVGR